MTTMKGVKCKSGTLLIDCLRDQSPERNPQLSQVGKKARASLSCEEWTHSFEDTLSFICVCTLLLAEETSRKYLPTMKWALFLMPLTQCFFWQKKYDSLPSCVAGSVAEAATSLNGRRGLRFSLILPPLSISKDQQGILPLVQHPLHLSHPPTFEHQTSAKQQRSAKDVSLSSSHLFRTLPNIKISKGYFSLILPPLT